MVGKREEKSWVEEVEAWAEEVSQLLPFLASSLIAPVGFFGVSLDTHIFWHILEW